jgi:hypothetical protein
MTDVRSEAAEALIELSNEICMELSSIEELADTMAEQVGSDALTPARIEALCLSIRKMAQAVSAKIEHSIDAKKLTEARHG